MKVDHMPNGKWPHVLLNYVGPLGHRMKQDGMGPLDNTPNKAFSNPILPMGADCTESKFLTLLKAGVLEKFSGIHTIISSDALC
jgi:hypothetical protein